MDKKYTSNVEDKRLNIEEQPTMGQHILPQQIWRDGALIPGSPDDVKFKSPEMISGVAVQTSYFNCNYFILYLLNLFASLKTYFIMCNKLMNKLKPISLGEN